MLHNSQDMWYWRLEQLEYFKKQLNNFDAGTLEHRKLSKGILFLEECLASSQKMQHTG